MALVDLVMPKMGESIKEATILRWHKKPGDFVKQDETLMDIATDKVDSEVPSTTEGVLEEALFNENDVVPVGAVIARIRTGQQAAATAPVIPPQQPIAVQAPVQEIKEVPYQPGPAHTMKSNGIRFYSPLVLNIAASEGISMGELERIAGTGNEGRVTKKDILDYVSGDRTQATERPGITEKTAALAVQEKPQPMVIPSSTTVITPQETRSPVTYSGNVEIIEMDRMRRLIADHMVKSKSTSAHVTSFSEADVTNMVMWREKIKKDFEKREGEKITFTPLFIEAIVKCIKKYPMLNSSIDGDKIIIKKDINIGMATALPSGNLIVPIIKGADQLNLVGLTRHVNNMANNARNNKLRPDDTQGGHLLLPT